MQEVSVKSPATVSNVVCGFDTLGFALAEPSDEMTLRKIDEPGVRIIHRDGFGLPVDPRQNVAGIALLAMMEQVQVDGGFELEITKQIMPGSGIGSSAASACGAVLAANRLLDERLTRTQLIEFAMKGEMAASGARHADNIAPCMLGGFTLVRSTDPLDVVALKFPPLFASVIHPQLEIKTSEARAILPKQVALQDAVHQWSNVGALVAALSTGNYELLSRSLEDHIVEPARKSLIPKFDELKASAMRAGAFGGGISGSGPSVFMLSQSAETAARVAEALTAVYSATDTEFKTYISPIAAEGVRFI
ncbi:MAG TPA: homoserine kinase [Pyrinomonadaceae bacterium]|nr:homoserine kinase [Pyrinomonadaceae bacterium]